MTHPTENPLTALCGPSSPNKETAMVHPRPTPSPRTGARQRLASSVAGRVLALTMMVGAAHQPARAQTADDSAVVVQTPRH